MLRGVILAVAIAVCAFVFAPASGAVNLPASQSSFASAQVVGGTLIWFQRNDRVTHKKHGGRLITKGVGAIYARPLTATKARRVYLPPAGQRIVAFKATNARIAVGLSAISKNGHAASDVIELTDAGPNAWPAKTLASETDPAEQDNCGRRVELAGVNDAGEILVQRATLESRGEGCALVRQVGQLTAYDAGGTARELKTRTSGWSAAVKWGLLPAIQPAGGDWMLQSLPQRDSSSPVSLWNAGSDESKTYTSSLGIIDRAEPIAGGGLMLRAYFQAVNVVVDPSDLKSITTASLFDYERTSWYHACGARLLEIHRTYRSKSGKWKLTLRDTNFDAVRTLPAKLARGTVFDACDGNSAVFHRARKHGGVHQWTLRLAD